MVKFASLLGVFLVVGATGYAQTTTSWTPIVSGNWNNAANWNNGIPNSPNSQVTIVSNITATTTISLDISATLDRLTIGDASNSFVIFPTAPGNILTFANNEADGDLVDTRINKTTGTTDIIAAGIVNTERLVFNVTAGTLALSGPVTGVTSVLEKAGAGTVDIRGQLNLHNHNVLSATGNKGLLVSAGTLNLSSPSNAIANTVKVTGGTLNFGGRAVSQVVTATVSSGSSLTLTSVAGLSAGMAISGANIPVGTYITGISGNVVTLSNPVSGNVTANDRLVFGGPSVAAASATGSGNSITLNSTAGISIGMNVHGDNIPAGTTVTGISGNTVTLSNSVSGGGVGANQVLNFGARTGDTVANANAFATGNVLAGATVVAVSDVSNLSLGMLVTGPNVPANTVIQSIDTINKTITLSAPLGGTAGSTAINALSALYFGTGQTTFASGLGELVVTGGAVNIGTAGNAVNLMIDADQISITGGSINLQSGNGGGVTTVLGGATNLLTLDGGTLNVLSSGTASGTVNFASTIDLVMNNSAIFNFSDNVGTIQTFAFSSITSTSNTTQLVSSVGNAVLQIGGDATDDVFNGQINMGGSGGNSRILKVGNETLTLGGTLDNSTARLEVQGGTVILAKASAPAVHAIGGNLIIGDADANQELVKLGGSYVGLGPTHMTNYTDQIHRGVTMTVNPTGIFDLNGFSEALNVIAGTGIITNTAAGTTSIIMIGQNNPTATAPADVTWSGTIQDGSATAKMALWKASANNYAFDSTQTYTGETMIGRSNLILRGANGALTGTSQVRVSTNGQLALLNNAGNNNNRINNSATIYLEKGGSVLLRRSASGTTVAHSSETMGLLRVGTGFSQVRTDHSDGANSGSNVNTASTLTYVFSDYQHDQGGIVAFTEFANNSGVGFSTGNAGTALSQVQFTNVNPNELVGNSNTADVADADLKVLIGAYGGTHNGAVDRFVTLDGSGFVRLLNATTLADFRTQITSTAATTASNLTLSSGTSASRDDNANVASSFNLLIGPTGNVLQGEHAYNAYLQSVAGTTTISEQNVLHLGTRTGDATYAGVDGSGMMLINLPLGGAFTMNGGTLSFGTREAIIRANNTSTFRSEIIGSGGLTKSGGALMELQGFNKYTGVTTITQGELRIYTADALGASGTGNGTKAINANLGMNSAVVTATDESLELLIGGNLVVIDQNNTWNGDILINNNFETGQNNNGTIQVNDNGSLIVNGRITGMSAALGGINGDPAYNGQGESRGLIFTNGGSAFSSVRNGIIKINGAISDEDFTGGVANHQRLNLFVRGYTGQSSVTNSRFNVFLKDATQTNGVLDIRSGYLHLEEGYASAGGPGGAGTTVTVVQDAFVGGTTLVVDTITGLVVGTVITGPGIEPGTTIAAIDGATNTITLSDPLSSDVAANTPIASGAGGQLTILRQHDGGNVDRAGTVSALLLSEAGAVFRSPSIQIGENTGSYSSNNIALIGGENTSGTVTYGTGANTVDMNPIAGTSGGSLTVPGATSSGASSLTLTSAANLKLFDGVSGTGIAPGTYITAINGNVITLSQPTNANIAANGTISYGYLSTKNNLAGTPGTTKTLAVTAAGTGGAAGQANIFLADSDWLEVGMRVSHPNIPGGATIIDVDYGANRITISANITGGGIASGNTVTFDTVNNNSAGGARIVFLQGASGLKVGMGITGAGIQADTKIIAINAATGAVVLSKPTNGAPPAIGGSYTTYLLSHTITLSRVDGLQVGMGISGTGIRPGTVITAIDPDTKTITLSAATNGVVNETAITTAPLAVVAYNLGATAASGTTTLALSSVAGLSIGSTVSGTGIPNGTVIVAINPATNTVTLSQATSAQINSGSAVNFRKTSNFSETRLYQAEGGKTDFQMRFTEDTGFSLQNEVGALTKVGRGLVILSGSTQGASDLDGGINVHGGTLEFLYGQANTNNSRVNGGNTASPYQLTMAGGALRLSALGNSTVAQTVNEAFRGVFTLRAGNSSITGGATSDFATIVLSLGLDNPFDPIISLPTSAGTDVINPDWYWRAPDRFSGATILFDGTPTSTTTMRYLYSQNALAGNGAFDNGRLGYFTSIPYATYRAGSIGNPAYVDFASFIPEEIQNSTLVNTVIGDSSGLLGTVLFTDYGGGSTFASNLANWGTYVDGIGTEYFTDSIFAGATGFTGTLNANSGSQFYGAKLIRFAAAASSTITIASGTRLVLGTTAEPEGLFGAGYAVQDGGAILISNSVGNNNQAINGGEITSALLSTYYTQPLTTTTASSASTAGQNTLQVGVATSKTLKVGMTVSGVGIVPGSYITAIDTATGAVTLNTGLSGAVSGGATLEFRELPQYHVAKYQVNTNGASGTDTLVMSSVADLVVGMEVSSVSGTAVAPGTTIIAINTATNTITLSKPLNAAIGSGVAIQFDLFAAQAPNIRPANTVTANLVQSTKTFDSRDLIIHNYNELGTFTIGSTIVDHTGAVDGGPSRLNLVIAGPGFTHLTAVNSYTGSTFVSGGGSDAAGNPVVGTLWIENENRLGATPGTVNPISIFLNGGRLRFRSDGVSDVSLGAITLNTNRGITLGGNGGYIDLTNAGTTLTYGGVIRSEDNIQMGNLGSNQYFGNIGSGDLIKEGLGRLILTNDNSVANLIAPISSVPFTLWNAYYGVTDVKAGTLQVNIGKGNSGILGSNDSTIDGTIIRTGARLDLEITGGMAHGTREWITLAGGVLGTTASHVDGVLDGVINVTANSEINVAAGNLRLNASSGFLQGTGKITKTGAGSLMLFENSSDFSGGWEIREGSIITRSQGRVTGQGGTIVIGVTGSASGLATAGLYQRSRTSGGVFTTEYEVTQNITIQADSTNTQVKEIGVRNDINESATITVVSATNGSPVVTVSSVANLFTGMVITSTATGIPGGATILAIDPATNRITLSANATTTVATGSLTIGYNNSGMNNDRYSYSGTLTLNDDLQVAYRDDRNNTALAVPGSTVHAEGSQQTGQTRIIGLDGNISGIGNLTTVVGLINPGGAQSVNTIFELNGENSAWVGDLITGNAADTAYQKHTVRLGTNTALTTANDVTMRNNSVLQVAGHTVEIGTLSVSVTDGSVALATGASTRGIIIENASNDLATLIINQLSNTNWDVLFRDGTTPAIYSASTTQTHSNKLNITKRGAGIATMTQNNTYTGTTTIESGTLRSGTSNVLPDASPIVINATGGGITATLDLNGNNDSIASLTMGGTTTTSTPAVQTGAGTLTLLGNVTYDATNNPLGGTISGNLSLGNTTRTFTVGNSTSAADDLTVSAVVSSTGGIIKTGTGTMVLAGDNSYTGTTTVSQGRLHVGVGGSEFIRGTGDTGGTDGGQGGTTVNSGAFLSGTGRLSGSASTNHSMQGTLQVGSWNGTTSGIGKMDVQGTLNGTGGIFSLQLSGNSMNDATLNTFTTGSAGYDSRITAQIGAYDDSVTSAGGGANHDFLSISGQLTVDTNSRIQVLTEGSYTYAAGDIFDILDWAGVALNGLDVGSVTNAGSAQLRSGGLSGDLELPTLSGGLMWDVQKLLSNGILIVVNNVPEPNRALLFVFGFAGVLLRRRRPLRK